MRRLFILAIIALAVGMAYQFGLFGALSLANIKAQQAHFAALYAAAPAKFISGFFALYVLVTALSIPGAVIMTLAAGALFGLVTGTILVSFASTIGATLAFLSARFLLRDWVQGKFGDRLTLINEGMARDGAFYLFTMRLIPLIPFFAINLAMGLTPIRARTFYWVSQLGMLAGTLVYVNAGTQLARINRLSDISSPTLIASFAALGLFPWIARAIIKLVRKPL